MDDKTKKLIETLMKRPIAFQRIFKTITGTTNAALFLSQAWYWKDRASITINKKSGWFYKTAQEWEEETGLTRREQENARRICRDRGLIEEKLKRANKHATRHFWVNTKRITELIEHVPSLHQTAKLGKANKALPSLHQTANLLDSPKPPIYLTENTRDYPSNGKGIFKIWNDMPERYHPYFQACTNKPISLPEPADEKEIKAWLETFNEWIKKGFTPDQVINAARWARKNNKAIARPGSLTWLLNDQHSRKNGQEDYAKDTSESILEKLAKNQRRK
jgi:hypothetical protein